MKAYFPALFGLALVVIGCHYHNPWVIALGVLCILFPAKSEEVR